MSRSTKFKVNLVGRRVYFARDVGDTFVYMYRERPTLNKEGCYSGAGKAVYVPRIMKDLLCPIDLQEGELIEVSLDISLTGTNILGAQTEILPRIYSKET